MVLFVFEKTCENRFNTPFLYTYPYSTFLFPQTLKEFLSGFLAFGMDSKLVCEDSMKQKLEAQAQLSFCLCSFLFAKSKVKLRYFRSARHLWRFPLLGRIALWERF